VLEERIKAELEMVRQQFPSVVYRPEERWVCVSAYPLPEGWSRPSTDVAFQIPSGYPSAPPYGIYVPQGLTFKGNDPSDYTSNAGTQPPFGGVWGFFSWAPVGDDWIPRSAIEHGPNLLHWVRGFAERFEDGA